MKIQARNTNKRTTSHSKEVTVAKVRPTLWQRFYAPTNVFVKKYSFAAIVTAIIIVLIAGAYVIRVSQKTSLGRLLETVTTIGQDYNSLTSSNASTAPTRGDTSADNKITNTTPTGSAGSTTFSSTPTAPSGGGGGGGGTTTPVFAASITSFSQTGTTLECGPGKPSKQKCSKRYTFEARTATQNGPGTVNYGWLSNLSGANENGSYSAGSGAGTRTLQKSVSIACQSAGTYSMQFIITSPNQVSSSVRTINHDCAEI